MHPMGRILANVGGVTFLHTSNDFGLCYSWLVDFIVHLHTRVFGFHAFESHILARRGFVPLAFFLNVCLVWFRLCFCFFVFLSLLSLSLSLSLSPCVSVFLTHLCLSLYPRLYLVNFRCAAIVVGVLQPAWNH